MRCRCRVASGVACAVGMVPLRAFAHGIGERYDLPLPLWLWLSGGGIVIAASFVVSSLGMRGASAASPPVSVDASTYIIGRFLTQRWLQRMAQLFSVAAFLLVVTASFIGDQTPTRNIAPVTIWVIWWIGFAYLSALAGDLWSVVNPWAVIFAAVEKALQRRGLPIRKRVYPTLMGVWPAVVLFAAFSWLELVYDSRAVPSQLGILIVGYSLITWAGMLRYGREVWLAHGDPFAVAFRTLARFAPTEIRSHDTVPAPDGVVAAVCNDASARTHKLALRPWGAGLVPTENVSSSMLVFISLLLSTVTFDGFLATPTWNAIEGALFKWATALEGSRLMVINTVGLMFFVSAFLAIYLLFARWMSRASAGALSAESAARLFVMSLIPIAIGYHIAHYSSYLLTQGQLVIRLASDPFGFGWNLFGTARYRPNYEIVGARFTWYLAVLAIVAGHIFAVHAAHKIAFREIRDREKALGSQLPMLVLMIGYTMISLWIIAQPVTEFTQN